MFGSHLSIAGDMSNALRQARGLGLGCLQVFTKNQQQWNAPPLEPAAIAAWKSEYQLMGWEGGDRVVSHASYLINLASCDDALWRKSTDLMFIEIDRCEQLGIPLVVHHPGSFVGWDLARGMARIVDAFDELFKRTAGYSTVVCLEATAGSGSSIGGRFEHLADLRSAIISRTGQPGRVGFCIDTCHIHAAGYDIGSAEKAAGVLSELDRVCGLQNVRALHLNDSMGAAGSKLDRHQHIGRGTIGLAGFGPFVQNPVLSALPKILETPKGEAPNGEQWDSVNLRALASLLPGGAPFDLMSEPAPPQAVKKTKSATPAPEQTKSKKSPVPRPAAPKARTTNPKSGAKPAQTAKPAPAKRRPAASKSRKPAPRPAAKSRATNRRAR